jgi:hypothetical protein
MKQLAILAAAYFKAIQLPEISSSSSYKKFIIMNVVFIGELSEPVAGQPVKLHQNLSPFICGYSTNYSYSNRLYD